MKLIEALKRTKYLEKKADELKGRIHIHCCDMDYEAAVYPDQKNQISSWMQAHRDILKEISTLHYRIQKTNIMTMLKIELGGNVVEKSLAEWIMRRRKLASMELSVYQGLGDKHLKEGNLQFSSGQNVAVKIRRYYDPIERDKKVAQLSAEPFEIDGKLEIVNATTDLME